MSDCYFPPELVGLNTTGSIEVLPDGTWNPILTGQQAPAYPQGCEGMCTVHVSTRSVPLPGPPPGANGKVLLSVGWGAGRASQEVICDGTRGAVLALPSREGITVKAMVVSAVAGEDLVPGYSYTVGCVAKWYTSGTGFEPMFAYPSIEVPESPIPSVLLRVPSQARRVRLLADDPAAYASLFAMFMSSAGGPTRYVSPYGEGWTPVVNGVEWLAIRCDIPVRATPVFELWP